MFWPEETTEDGYESHWSVNYLGHFLLTHLLYSRLKESSTEERPSRIVNLTSSVHFIGAIDFHDINGRYCMLILFFFLPAVIVYYFAV